MAKVVIAGRADCPYYAKVEILADSLVKNLPEFELHKIVVQPREWENWLSKTCTQRGWSHNKSPIVWRELVDRGGKGMYIGGANDFQEYCNVYYNVKSDFTSKDMKQVADENLQTKVELDGEEKDRLMQSKPLNVCITNAGSPVCYSMINYLAQGDILGDTTEVSIRLLDSEDKVEYLQGVQMEATDMAHKLLRQITVTTDPDTAFTDCSAIVFLDNLLKNSDESDESWLQRNNEKFANYGKIIDKSAPANVKIIIAGSGPVNFNAYMLMQNASKIPKVNIVALARGVENQAKAIIGTRLAVNTAGVVDTVIWGNINGSYIADVSHARVHGYDGAITGPMSYSVSVPEMVHDDNWLMGEYVELLKKRSVVLEESLGHPAAMAHAAALASFFRDWWHGTPEGQVFSLGVCSEGQYGVPESLVCSLPVKISPEGEWSVVEGLDLSNERKEALTNVINELKLEIEVIYPDPNKPVVTITSVPTPIPEEENGSDVQKKVFGASGNQSEEKSDGEKTDSTQEASKTDETTTSTD